jgi:hypothetical protein
VTLHGAALAFQVGKNPGNVGTDRNLSRLHIQPEVMANFIAPAAVRKEQFATKTGKIGYPQIPRAERPEPNDD